MPRLSSPQRAKSFHVRTDLLQRIRQRRIRVGQCIPSEPQLVTELGVSRGTIRRAIRDLIRDGIVETRAGVGHVVRSAKPRQTVGLFFGNDYFQPFHRLLLEAFEDQLREQGLQSRLYVGRFVNMGHVVDHTQLVKDLKRGRLAGVLTVSWSDKDSAKDRALGRLMRVLGVPCVPITNVEMPAAVGAESRSITYLGARHLLSRGCRRVGVLYVGGKNKAGASAQLQGYDQALREAGVEPDPVLQCSLRLPGEAEGFHAFKEWWPRSGGFSGLVIGDDVVAKGAIAAAVDLGIDIPGQLKVAALTHRGSDLFVMRPFTKLVMNPAAYARQAVEHLLALFENPNNPPQAKFLPVTLGDEDHDANTSHSRESHLT